MFLLLIRYSKMTSWDNSGLVVKTGSHRAVDARGQLLGWILLQTHPGLSFNYNFRIICPPPYRYLVDARGHCPVCPSPNATDCNWIMFYTLVQCRILNSPLLCKNNPRNTIFNIEESWFLSFVQSRILNFLLLCKNKPRNTIFLRSEMSWIKEVRCYRSDLSWIKTKK